jgi:TolB-like protein
MRRRPRLVLVLIAASAMAMFAWSSGGVAARPSVAVRFEFDRNGSADDARIADGIAIEITRQLDQIDGLDVRATVRATRYGNQREDTHAFGIGRGAALVLDGLVLSDGGAVRQIHASLVSTSRRTTLWSRYFTPKNNDIFRIDAEIASVVAESLRLSFDPARRRDSIAPALQTTFLRARALQAGGGSLRRPEAVELFEQITRQAPAFTPAVAALATTLGGHLSVAGPPPLDPRMAAAARAAYEADPQMPEANAAMGLLSARTCQWAAAATYFAEALRKESSATAAWTDYVISTLLPVGRIADAIGVLRDASTADPSSVDVARTLTYVQLQNNDHASALASSHRVVTQEPELEFADQSRGRALSLSGQLEEALAWFGSSGSQWGHRGYVLARMGRLDEARALAEGHPGEPARQMLIYAALNDVERALDALRRTALDNPWRTLVWMAWPEIEPVFRGDPRAAAVRAQLLRPLDDGGCTLGGR